MLTLQELYSNPSPLVLDNLQSSTHDMFVESLARQVNSATSPSNRGRNKLRTYSFLNTQFGTY